MDIVIKAILLCRFCTYPSLREHHLIPASVVLTVNISILFFFMCNGPQTSDKDSYFVQSHYYYTLRVQQRAYPIADMLETMITDSTMTHVRFCAPVWIPENMLIQHVW